MTKNLLVLLILAMGVATTSSATLNTVSVPSTTPSAVTVETVPPVQTNKPIVVEEPLLETKREQNQVKVEAPRVIAEKTVKVNRGGDSSRITLTLDRLETLPVMTMNASAYTLSEDSCGKSRSNPYYGITKSGVRAESKNTVAVDPKVIPLWSVLYIDFPKPFDDRDGIYVAQDTGSAIKGKKIDIFFGEDKIGENKIEKQALEFGRRKVKVYIIKRGGK